MLNERVWAAELRDGAAKPRRKLGRDGIFSRLKPFTRRLRCQTLNSCADRDTASYAGYCCKKSVNSVALRMYFFVYFKTVVNQLLIGNRLLIKYIFVPGSLVV